MNQRLAHRGPDADGVWLSADGALGLGHRRLAIIDLGETGAQPMRSVTGRFVVSYNGETYNFEDLRAHEDLAGVAFRGTSDTEVILACFEAWGVAAAVERMNGLFAFAAWDTEERCLYLARDRFGKKPLYVAAWPDRVAFASEVHAFDALDRALPLDREALDGFLRRGYVPQPRSIHAPVRQVLPGQIVRVGPDEASEARRYWTPRQAAEVARASGLARVSLDRAVDELEELLLEAVRVRMVSDVPLGAFLSGGIDSSLVVALMQRLAGRPVNTFTIGFEEGDYDESAPARAVAEHLGTHHTERIVTPEDAQAVIPRLAGIYGEPFADSSQIPTYLVAQLARRHVTVALTGDGGDEVFAGYNRYQSERLWRRAGWMPGRLRRLVARGLLRVSPARWSRTVEGGGRLVPRPLRVRLAGDKIHKGAALLASDGLPSMYERLVSHHPPDRDLVRGAAREPIGQVPPRSDLAFTEEIMLRDTEDYLVGDILTKVDRATMAVGLEARAPLLDHRVFSFAWTLPLELKLGSGRGKLILRRLLARYVPSPLFDRPKMGFGIPVGRWIRGPLHDWAEELLAERRLRSEGILRPEPVRKLWDEHRSGRRNWEAPLWDVLMFQQWLEARSGPVPPHLDASGGSPRGASSSESPQRRAPFPPMRTLNPHFTHPGE